MQGPTQLGRWGFS